jgi:hypothetical protein
MIRNKLFSFTKAKVLGVVCLATMIFFLPLQAQDSTPKVLQFEGKLTFHQDIPVGLVSGTAEYPQLIEVKSIRFEATYGNAWGVTARVGWLPVKDTTWQLTIEMLDEKGQVLQHPTDMATLFTCKAVGPGKTDMLYADLDLDSMQDQKRRHATRFRVCLEPLQGQVGETDPADIDTHTLEVTVVDKESQKPIADAAVVFEKSYYLKDIYRRDKILYPTDSQGRCFIKLVKNRLLQVSINAQKKGYCTINKSWSNSGSWPINRAVLARLPQHHVLKMVPTGSVGGIIQDTEGNAIEAVEVRFSASGMTYIRRSVKTDANGSWRVDGIPSETDRLTLRLRHPQYGGDHIRSRSITGQALLNARALKHIEILRKGPTIKGTITDEHGEPVVRATVLMTYRSYSPIYTLTDTSGAFQLVYSSEASTDREAPILIVEAPGYVPVQKTIYIKPKMEPLEFHLTRGRNVTCRVEDTEGQPVIGASTIVEPLPDNSRYSIWLKDTDKQGEFLVPNIPKKDIKLTVGKQGYIAVRDYVLPSSDDEITVIMKHALRVRGIVTDSQNGKPIPNFEIAVVFESGGRDRISNPVAFAEGTYELSFDEARPEKIQLKVSAIGYEPATSEEIKIDEDQRTINFKLARSRSFDKTTAGRPREEVKPTGPRRITGVVRDEKGKLVSDAIICTRPWIAEDTITNAKGAFTLKLRRRLGSTMGSMSSRQETSYLLVRHIQRNLAAAIELDDDAETLDIKLSPGIILSGKVVDVKGKGIPQAELSLTFWTSDFGYSIREEAHIDSEGNYEITAVPSGHRYSVNASAEGYGQQNVRLNTSEAADNRMELEPMVLAVADLSISGVVVDVEDKPVAGVRIYTYGRGQPNRNTITDEMGRFLIENMCKGRIQIQANTRSQPSLYGRVETDGGATDIRIVVAERDARGRPVPKKPPSLVGKNLPDLQVLKVDLSPNDVRDKTMLVCFFDMQQRPSRNCLRQLSKRTQELKAKDVVVVAVQASKIEQNSLNQWVKKNDIPFPVGMIEGDEEQIRFTWGVRSLPWLILTDAKHIVHAEGFTLSELNEKIQ